MPWTVLAHSQGCENGNCPTFFTDSGTGDVYVRGYLPDGTETDVRIPSTEWAYLVAQLPR